MIELTIFRNSDGVIHGFRVSGHAGFAKKGKDVVCAAASVLAINTVNSIEGLTEEKVSVVSNEKKGLIECVLPGRKNGIINKDADLLINSMLLGFKALEGQYGDYIRIKEAPND